MPNSIIPTTTSITPQSVEDVVNIVRQAHAASTPLYPIGGGTSLDFGLPPAAPGTAVEMNSLTRIIDYPCRDMTITVEAGITLQSLAQTLAAEGQRLPIDAPHAEQATLGGVVAAHWSGPRRYGHGTIRDYVIGIAAVDGRGRPFHGGGRVVKNVAGYDMCKLLTGSLGTLGIVTEVTLKLKPLAEATAFVVASTALHQAEGLLAALVHAAFAPTALELVGGAGWSDDAAIGPLLQSTGNSANAEGEMPVAILAGLEGSSVEIEGMIDQIRSQWQSLPIDHVVAIRDEAADAIWSRLTEGLSPTAAAVPLTIKASVLPGRVTQFLSTLLQLDPQASVQAHAGNGIVLAQCRAWQPGEMGRAIISQLRPAAAGGHLIVLAAPSEAGLTHQAVWGGNEAYGVMNEVKRAFDPANILNRGRFVYSE